MYKLNRKNEKEYRKVTAKTKYFVFISLFLLLLLVIVGSSSWNLHVKVFGFIKNATIVSGEKANSLLLNYVDYGTTNTITYADQEYYAYTYDGNTHTPTITVRDDDARDFDLSKFEYTYTCLYLPNNTTIDEWVVANPKNISDKPKDSGLYQVDITYSDSTYSNYVGSVTLYFAILPKAIDVSVSPNESVYGNSINPIEQTVAEGVLCGSDSVDSLNSTFSLENRNNALSEAGEEQRMYVGEYDIIGTDNSRNYAITFKPKVAENGAHALYTITKRPITVEILDQTSVYGDLPINLTNLNVAAQLTANTLAYTDALSDVISVSSQLNLMESTGTISSNAGTYAIVGSNENPNYEVTFVGTLEGNKGTYSITKAPLNMTATSFKLIYGAEIPTYSVAYEGFKNNETENVIDGNLTFTCGYAQNKQNGSVGTYTITPSLDEQTNYEINPIDGTLTVSKKPLTLTLDAKSTYYGEESPSFTCTATGFVYNESFTIYKSDFNLTNYVTDNYTVGDNIGEYNITWSKSESELENILTNYDCTLATNKLIVNSRPITVTIEDKSSVYGDTPIELTATVAVTEGYTLTGNPIYGTEKPYTLLTEPTVTNVSSIGTYPIIGESENTNYSITFKGSFESTKGTYTVTKKAITITWSNTEFTYDGTSHKPTVTAGGLVNGDACEVTISGEETNAGTYTATAESVSNSNYSLPTTDLTANFTINPKTITINWGNTAFSYDGTPHIPTATAVDLVINDTCSITVSGEKTDVGTYTAIAESVSNSNYSLPTAKTCEFTITQATTVITGSLSIADWTYGGTANTPSGLSTNFGTLQYQYSSEQNGTYSATQPTNAGSYFVKGVVDGNSNFSSCESTPFAFTIEKAPLTVKAENKVVTVGDSLPTFTVKYEGFVNGEDELVLGGNLTFNSNELNSSTVGEFEIIPSGLTSDNYNITFEKGVLKVVNPLEKPTIGKNSFAYSGTAIEYLPEGFDSSTMSISGNSETDAGTYTATVTPLDGAYWSDETTTPVTFEWIITKIEVTITWENIELTYNGTEQTPTATIGNVIGDDDCTITVSGAQTNVGTYTATATLSGAKANNYVLPANSTCEFTIIQATTVISGTISIADWTYGGTASTPTGLSTNFGEIQYQYSSDQNGEYTTTVPTNAGSYYIKGVVVGNDNYSSAESTSVGFKIDKANINVAVAYHIDGRRVDNLIEHGEEVIIDSVTVKGVKGETLSYSNKILDSFTAKFNGDNCSHNSEKCTQNITMTFTFSDAVYSNNYNNTYVYSIVVDAVAKIGSTYYGTVEKALAVATSGNTVYIIGKKNPLVCADCKVESGVTLCLPLDESGTWDKTGSNGVTNNNFSGQHAYKNTNSTYNKLYANVTIAAGVTLTNNGIINIGGTVSGGGGGGNAGFTCGEYSQISLDRGAKIDSISGSIVCYGYIDEIDRNNGSEVIMGDGATAPSLKIPFVVIEHRGGTAFSGLANSEEDIYAGKINATPFNRFLMPNITAKLTINYGAIMQGFADLYAGGSHNTTQIQLIGANNDYLINIANGAKVVSKYNPDTKITDLKIKGSVTINSLLIDVGASTTLSTAEVYFPLSWYYKITLSKFENGSEATVSVPTQAIKILPGCEVTLEDGVTANMKKVFVTQSREWIEKTGTGSTTYDGNGSDSTKWKAPGKLVVNGTLNVESINGVISTDGSTGQLTISSSVRATSKEVYTAGKDKYTLVIKEITVLTYTELGRNEMARGEVYTTNESTSLQNFVVGLSYKARNGTWMATTGTIVFDINYGENSVIKSINKNIPYTLSLEDYPSNPTRVFYTLEVDGNGNTQWYLDKECTQIIEPGTILYVGTTLYAKWTAISYKVNYQYVYGTNVNAADVGLDNPIDDLYITADNGFIINSLLSIDDIDRTVEGYSLTGWYIDIDCQTKVEKAFDLLSKSQSLTENSITVYGKWDVYVPSFKVVYSTGVGEAPDGMDYSTDTVLIDEQETWKPNKNGSEFDMDTSVNYYFDDWYTDPNCDTVFTNFLNINENETQYLYAKWIKKSELKIDNDSNNILHYKPHTEFALSVFLPEIKPTKDGQYIYWTLDGTEDSKQGELIRGKLKEDGTELTCTLSDSANITLNILDRYEVITKLTNSSVTITYSGHYSTDGINVSYSTEYKPVASNNTTTEVEKLCFYAYTGGSITNIVAEYGSDVNTLQFGNTDYTSGSGVQKQITENTIVMASSTKKAEGGLCVVEGTLVTLADGTQKKVEDLTYNDSLLVFNHTTGQYESSPLLFNAHAEDGPQLCRVIYLTFSDGIRIGVITEHAFFDLELNKYVYISEENAKDFIGHKFAKVIEENNSFRTSNVTLIAVEVVEQFVRRFSPFAYLQLSAIVEGLWGITEAIDANYELHHGYINIFEFDENMMYDSDKMKADIEKHGLYTYEEFSDLVSYDEFMKGPWRFFKVSEGKGKITYEDIRFILVYGYRSRAKQGLKDDLPSTFPWEKPPTDSQSQGTPNPYETTALPPPTSSTSTSSSSSGEDDTSNDDES